MAGKNLRTERRRREIGNDLGTAGAKRLTHLSLFSGIGGIDLAAEAAGFETVCQCEQADYPAAVLRKHWPDVPRFKDIRTLTKEAFYERTGCTELTLVSGGFPCQPFSCAGFRKGFADSRYLWPEMCRVINELRPHFVLGENVANFANMGLHRTLSDLEEAGYAAGAFIIPACAVGARHERKRTFIIGIDVSHSPCVRHGREAKDAADAPPADGLLPRDAEGREGLGAVTAGNHLFYGTGGRPVIPLKSGVGGMADGIPAGMDGRILWRIEPPGIPRLCPDVKDRAKRLKCLGNSVVPAQAYPILKYIADIEKGECAGRRAWNGGCGTALSGQEGAGYEDRID